MSRSHHVVELVVCELELVLGRQELGAPNLAGSLLFKFRSISISFQVFFKYDLNERILKNLMKTDLIKKSTNIFHILSPGGSAKS